MSKSFADNINEQMSLIKSSVPLRQNLTLREVHGFVARQTDPNDRDPVGRTAAAVEFLILEGSMNIFNREGEFTVQLTRRD